MAVSLTAFAKAVSLPRPRGRQVRPKGSLRIRWLYAARGRCEAARGGDGAGDLAQRGVVLRDL